MENSIETKASGYRWVIIAIMWAAMFIATASQFQVAALAYQIIPALNLSQSDFALILSAPMMPAVIFSLLAGALADRFGVKKVVTFGIIMSIIGIYFRYVATSFWDMYLLMFLSGMCPALLNANCAKLIGAWFPRHQMGTAMGLYFTAMGVGMTTALATSAYFPTVKSAYVTAGFLMAVIFILWILLIKTPQNVKMPPAQPALRSIRKAAASKNVWLAGFALMFFMGANMAFVGFLPNALTQLRNIEPGPAGLMTSLVTVGIIVGNIIGPVLSDKIGRIKPFLAPIAAIGAICMYASWVLSQGMLGWILLLVVGITLGISVPLIMSFPMLLPEIGPAYAGSAGGLMATMQLLGAVVIPSFIIAPIAGENYTLLFFMASVTFFLLGVVSLFLPELGSKAKRV